MKLSILIPTGGHVASRDEAMKFCVKRWRKFFPSSEIILGSSNHTPFNRSAARNDAFSKSTGDMLIVADSDTIINKCFVEAAIGMIVDGPCWSIPFKNYYSLPKETTERILKGESDQLLFEPTFPADNAEKSAREEAARRSHYIGRGIHVITREGWEKCGLYDEGFIGWGCEDGQRKSMMLAMLGAPNVVPGFCLHLWHERFPEESNQNPFMKQNSERLEKFRKGLK